MQLALCGTFPGGYNFNRSSRTVRMFYNASNNIEFVVSGLPRSSELILIPCPVTVSHTMVDLHAHERLPRDRMITLQVSRRAPLRASIDAHLSPVQSAVLRSLQVDGFPCPTLLSWPCHHTTLRCCPRLPLSLSSSLSPSLLHAK